VEAIMNQPPARATRLALLAVLPIFLLSVRPAWAEDRRGVPAITVKKADWGDADHEDIEAVCLSVAGEMVVYFPKRKLDPIVIGTSRTSGPGVAFGIDAQGRRRVSLDVKDRQWAQFAYQFGHELGHILCNYREAKNPNLWFEEALCETASLFALRRMSQTWKTRPPYSNWKGYAGSLESYADRYIRGVAKLERERLPQWLGENEAALRKLDRPKIHSVAAHVLLPLLEKTPAHWEALNWLNQFDAKKELTFEEYLEDWHARVPTVHKPFVADVAKAFGISLK
jgi:hypothetical protein